MSSNVSQTDKPPVIVIGKNANALGVIRSLHAKGIDIYLVVTRRGNAASYSRYLRKSLIFSVSEMFDHPERFLELLEKETPAGSVIIPAGDLYTLWVSRYLKQISRRVHTLFSSLISLI